MIRMAVLEDRVCVTVFVAKDLKSAFDLNPEAVECPQGYGVGDSYDGENWIKVSKPEKLTTAQIREKAYEEMTLKTDNTPLLLWHDHPITVDEANVLWTKYAAEGSPTAEGLTVLIADAKAYIRELYPDEEVQG